MKIVLASLASLLLISCSEHTSKSENIKNLAAISGTYQGPGIYIKNNQQPVACQTIRMVLSSRPNSLTIEEYYYKCGNEENTDAEPIVLETRGADLYFGGVKVGTYSEDGFDMKMDFGVSKYNISVKKQGSIYKFLGEFIGPNNSLSVTGNLNKI